MAGFWEKAKYWLDIGSSHGVGECSVTAVCPRAGGLSRRRRDGIIVIVVADVNVVEWCWMVTVVDAERLGC